MSEELRKVRAGVAIVLLGLMFGFGMGVSFGVNEDAFKDYVAEGVAANPEVHDEKSKDKIWRYAQRAHFHATGIAAFSLGLIILVMFSGLSDRLKSLSSVLIGLGSVYPLGWLSMFLLAPAMGRGPAHEHLLTEAFTYLGVGGLLFGSLPLLANIFFGLFRQDAGNG